MYNKYLAVRKQIEEKVENVVAWSYTAPLSTVQKHSLAIERALFMFKQRMASNNIPGRGFMSSASIRGSEIAYTAQLARILDRLAFPDPFVGAFLHQAPTRNRLGNPELADLYAAGMVEDTLADPAGGGDSKLHDFDHSERTSSCHTVNLVSVNHEYHDWPIVLGFPNTPEKFEIQVHIPVNKGMWRVPVACARPNDLALLVTLSGAVHRLIMEDISTTSPLTSMMPAIGLVPLKNDVDCRVFLDTDTRRVYKYYDTDETLWRHNMEYIQKYGSLKHLVLRIVTSDKKIVRLEYDYIEGSHQPSNITQFVGVLQTLHALHEANVVHGDVRACNIVFTDDNSYLIDFDLLKDEGENYSLQYKYIEEERHTEAKRGKKMNKAHDRTALAKVLIKVSCSEAIIDKLEDINISLLDVITDLNLMPQ